MHDSEAFPTNISQEANNQVVAEHLAHLFLNSADGDSSKNRFEIGLALGISYLQGLLQNPIVDDEVLRADIFMSIKNSQDTDNQKDNFETENHTKRESFSEIIKQKTFKLATEVLGEIPTHDIVDIIFDMLSIIDKQSFNLENAAIRDIVMSKAVNQSKVEEEEDKSILSELNSLISNKKNEKISEIDEDSSKRRKLIQARFTQRLNTPSISGFEVEDLRTEESIEISELKNFEDRAKLQAKDVVANSITQCLEYAVLTYPVKFLKSAKEKGLLKTRVARETLDSLIVAFESLGSKKLHRGNYSKDGEFMDDFINVLQQNINIDIPYLLKLLEVYNYDSILA